DTTFAQKISQLPGVGLVSISGGQKPAVRIMANPTALASYGMSLEQLLIVIAVADTHPPGMAPDLGREKQEPQACRRQRGVLERCHLGVLLAIEQHQPAV